MKLMCRMDWRVKRWGAVGVNADEATVVFVEGAELGLVPGFNQTAKLKSQTRTQPVLSTVLLSN